MWEMNIWHDGMFGWGDPVLMEIWTDPIPQPSVINTTIQAFRQIERERVGIAEYFGTLEKDVQLCIHIVITD